MSEELRIKPGSSDTPPELLASGPGGGHRKGTRMRKLGKGRTTVASGTAGFGGPYKLHVPAAVARMVGPERVFQVELTDEGILYRYIEGGEPVSLPDWLLTS